MDVDILGFGLISQHVAHNVSHNVNNSNMGYVHYATISIFNKEVIIEYL